MAGKYDNFFKQYEEQVKNNVFSGYSDKQMNWISVTKQAGMAYIQLLQDGLLPVPFHNYVEIKGGKHANFVCRKFIQEDCPICDNIDHLNKEASVRTSYVANAIEFENVGPRQFRPVFIDYKVSKDRGEEILKEYPRCSVIKDNDAYTFQKLPKIGVLTSKKAVNDALPLIMTQFGQVQGEIICLTRTGEKLDTKYNAMRIDDSNLDLNSDPVKVARLLAKDVDDYIDDYISLEKVKNSLPQLFASGDVEDHESDYISQSSESETSSSNEMTDEQVDEMIAKMYGKTDN